MRHANDILWKGILEEVFDDFLRFVYPDAGQVFDMERGFIFLDKELAEMYPEPEKKTDTRFADKLVRVFRRDGGEEWVLVHIEVQGETNKHLEFAERMFRYFYRIFDRYRRPVTAVVLFTGRDGKRMPKRFEYEFLKTRLVYEYHSLSILDFSDAELENSDNPFALVLLTAKTSLLEGKISDPELLERKVLVANKLRMKGFDEKKIDAIFAFLETYVHFEDPQMSRIFKERIIQSDKNKIVMGIMDAVKQVYKEQMREEWMEKGIEEGMEKGMEKGMERGMEKGRKEEQEKFVRTLLANTEFSPDKIAELAGVPTSFVEGVKETL